jgi:predicted negative regulator of RcsB-dependent stress response
MATYDLEEQEKLIALKDWWKQYGNLVLVTVILGLAVVLGARWWSHHKMDQAAEAAAVYNELLKAADARDIKRVADMSGALAENYPRTLYASLGAFVSAKAHFDNGDLNTAQAQLQWASEKSRDEGMRALGSLRLVQVLMDQKAYDPALKALEAKHPEAFAARFAEARGDILLEQGKTAEARAAYQDALAKLQDKDRFGRELLQFKLDALGAA